MIGQFIVPILIALALIGLVCGLTVVLSVDVIWDVCERKGLGYFLLDVTLSMAGKKIRWPFNIQFAGRQSMPFLQKNVLFRQIRGKA